MGKLLGDLATDIYGVSSTGTQSLVPRMKYQFSVLMTLVDSDGVYKSHPFQRIVSVDQPSLSSRTTTLNQYNKKRLVQTGVDYTPISLSAYDTKDAFIENFLKSYVAYYYSNTMTINDPEAFNNDIINEKLSSSNDLTMHGLKLTDQKYYIKDMTILKMSGMNDISITTIYNLMITSFTADELNYSDSSPLKYTLNFVYEGFNVETGDVNDPKFNAQRQIFMETNNIVNDQAFGSL